MPAGGPFVGRFEASKQRNATDRNTMTAKVPIARQNISVSFFFKKFELVVEVRMGYSKRSRNRIVLQVDNAKLVPRMISDRQIQAS